MNSIQKLTDLQSEAMDKIKCKDKETIPLIVHEKAQERNERREKRHLILELVLILALIATNLCWIIYESGFETVETTTTKI